MEPWKMTMLHYLRWEEAVLRGASVLAKKKHLEAEREDDEADREWRSAAQALESFARHIGQPAREEVKNDPTC